MGRRFPLELEDSAGHAFIGEHRPELCDLTALFRGLSELPLERAEEPEAWRNALPEGAHFLRMLGRTTALIRLRGPEVSDLVVKILPPSSSSPIVRWAETLRHSRAQRGYLWAHRLRAVGIDAPRPLGFLERKHQPALFPSLAVTEFVFAPTLVEVHDKELAELSGTREGVMRKRLVIRGVATLYGRLAAHDLFPAELGPEHIAVAADGIYVLALGKGRGEPLDAIGRLTRAFAGRRVLTRTDRLRFLASFLRHRPDPKVERRRLLEQLEARADTIRRASLVNLAGEPPPALEKQA
ncbi:MAG: hypothetical protein HYV07_33130 [Deltaproteobacteria bacterium]|nr:hypothetical protein [Deltaproteobacteria bacterium]